MPAQESRTSQSTRSVLADFVAQPQLAARRITVARGDVLYGPQDEARWLLFVHRGQLHTYRAAGSRGRRLVEVLGSDQWCGEAVFGRADVYGEQAVAAEVSTVSQISKSRLFTLLPQHPAVMLELLRQFQNKLAAAREDAGLVFEDSRCRLVRTLLRLSRSAAAAPHPDGVALRMTHGQLAQAVGAARETISEALTEFRRQNLLRTGRNQLLFNPETLAAFERSLRPQAVMA